VTCRAVGRTSTAALAVAAVLGGWSCGGGSPSPRGHDTTAGAPTAAPERLVAMPHAAIRRCAALGPRRDVPVRCPTRLPDAQWRLRYQTLERGRRAYLADFRTRSSTKGLAYHALAGGRVGRFPLRVRRGAWPAALPLARDLGLLGARQDRRGRWHPVRLEVVRSARVRSSRALVIRAAEFPDGGIHGGHLGVVWNEGRSGYTLTIHFSPDAHLTPALQEDLVLDSATAMSRFRAAG
jgi:hypothetical protein